MTAMKLTAFDADDLDVISAHLQDAIIRVGDIRYLPPERRFVLAADRFDWLSAERRRMMRRYERRRSGLHFDRVLKAQATCIRQTAKDAILNLLAIRFEPIESPGGAIILHFAGGGAIRLEVECVECAMADLGPAWSTRNKPVHAFEDDVMESRG